MFSFFGKKPTPPLKQKPTSPPVVKKDTSSRENEKFKPKFKIPYHFQKNNIITYSQSQIKKELKKYPGLLKTLGHAYQYQIIFNDDGQEKQYWFCRNLECLMPLLKYLKAKNWSVDWQEKPFIIKDGSFIHSSRY